MLSVQAIADIFIGGSVSRVAFTALFLLATYPISVLVYNVYFHPLSKFPGPKSWAASYVPHINALLRGNIIGAVADLHRQYGDVVRIGPNDVSFATESAWRDIYEYRPGHRENIKDSTWYIAPEGAPQNILTTSDPKVHARIRKYLSHSFTKTSLKEMMPVLESFTSLFISKLRNIALDLDAKDSPGQADLTDWINFFTIDVIGDLAFGETFGCMESNDYHPWVGTLFNFLKGMVMVASIRFYPRLGAAVERLLPKSVMDAQKRHVEFANEKVNRRINLDTDRPDLMTPFLKHNPDFDHVSIGEIESTFTILIVAGSETVSTTLCGIVNHLTKFPETLRKLEYAVRSRFQDEDQITVESTQDISYLTAVIEEGLRLCNPVSGGFPRVVPAGGDTYSGHYLPGGTKIIIRPYVMNTSSKNFALPTEFHPERWLPLEERPAQFKSDNLAISKPFSTGPANCLGQDLAWAEMRLVLARLVWAFDMSVDADRIVDWTKLRAMIPTEKKPMFIRLKVR